MFDHSWTPTGPATTISIEAHVQGDVHVCTETQAQEAGKTQRMDAADLMLINVTKETHREQSSSVDTPLHGWTLLYDMFHGYHNQDASTICLLGLERHV